MVKVEPGSSGMPGAADTGVSLDGSSNVTVCLLAGESVRWPMMALFSFLVAGKTLIRGVWSCCPLGTSIERRIRKGFRTPDFLLDVVLPREVMVGAVVMMAGAKAKLVCQ